MTKPTTVDRGDFAGLGNYKALFTDGDWDLVPRNYGRPGNVVFVRHRCDGQGSVIVKRPICWRCHQPMPEGLCALTQMMNWGSEG